MSPIYVPGKVTLKKESVAADPYYNNVSLLLHGDGANGSTTIVDSSPSPKTVTAFGNAQISTAQSKFGGASIAFDGDGDYLSAPAHAGYDFGAADFTTELWTFPTSWSSDKFLVSSTIPGGFFFGLRTGGVTNGLGIGRVGVAWDLETGVFPPLNQWSHVVFFRNGESIGVYVNGVLAGSASNSNSYSIGGSNIEIGRLDATRWYSGYMDDIRITKGVARYTANFTPPTAPFPEVLG